jgi:hypothetical protein
LDEVYEEEEEVVVEEVEEVEVHGASHHPVFSFHKDFCQSVELDGSVMQQKWWQWMKVWECDKELEEEVLVELSEEEE